MIIRCPECSTGFELPDDRVTADGTKLKCSKCEHVFRVRDSGGEPEIYYESGDRDGGTDQNDEADDSNPFPHAGMDLEPKKESAFGDLDADEEEMEAFQSAFDEDDDEPEETDDGPADFVETTGPPGAGGSSGGSSGDRQSVDQGGAAVATADRQDQQQQEEPMLTGDADNKFGDPEDHVDPSFGEGGAYFDPDEGKVDETSQASPASGSEPDEQSPQSGAGPRSGSGGSAGPAAGPGDQAGPPKGAGGPPPGASGPPPGAQTGGPPGGGGSPAPAAEANTGSQQPGASRSEATGSAPQSTTSPASSWEDDELEPHNIGGSTGKKVVTFLFLLSLVIMGFVGVVAWLNGGFVDFKAAPQMIEVAFGDGEYEPRDEWTGGTTTKVVEPSEPVEVEGLHAQLVDLGRSGEVFVIQGMLRNREETGFQNINLRAKLTTLEQRTMSEIERPLAGGDVSMAEIRNQRSVDGVKDLVGDQGTALEPGAVVPFTLVFDRVPDRVSNGEQFTYRVEVADKEES